MLSHLIYLPARPQLILRYACVDAEGNDVVRESKLSLIDLAGCVDATRPATQGPQRQDQ